MGSQENSYQSISTDVENNPALKRMIEESKSEYEQGKGMTTSELLKSILVEDFEK